MKRGICSWWLSALCLCAFAGRLSAQAAPTNALSSPGRDVTISLLTVGDGQRLWEMFGHTAIRIHDDVTGRDTVFNWGTFDFSKPHFILHFLRGLNFYQMAGGTMSQIMDDARRHNRTVTLQELDLKPIQKDSLLDLIRTNARPENVTYRYDYFRNNCATRPRDMIDQLFGGELHDRSNEVADHSYRWHAIDHLQANKLFAIGVDIALGAPSDQPITKWDEMFLPRELHDVLATIQLRDSTGGLRPLVRSERVLFQSTRSLEKPPHLALALLLVGLVIGVAFLILGARALEGGTKIRMTTAGLFTVWSLVAGLLGLVLTLLWAATDHVFARANMNVLVFNPLWLALVVMIPMAFTTGRVARATSVLTTALASLCAVALIADVLHLSAQSNLAIVGLTLPPALAMAVAAHRLARRPT